MISMRYLAASILGLCLFQPLQSKAWDYDVHRFINKIALTSLPADFPAFAKTPAAQERIQFLAGEPDRWRNSPDHVFRHCNGPDHYLDIEDLAKYGLGVEAVSPFRYEFLGQLSRGRALHPRNFPTQDSAKDADRTRSLVGFLPWAISEYYSKLKSAFSYLRELEQLGTPEEVSNAQQNAIYIMGVMGHFVGDATQPLHTTKHFNGWVGPNTNRYTTERTFHAWIDAGFLQKTGVKTNEILARVRLAQSPWGIAADAAPTNAFPAFLAFVVAESKLVEPLYQLEKEGKLRAGETGAAVGQEFLTVQLLQGGQMLGDIWYAAWRDAPVDTYLREELTKRKQASLGSEKR